jgi:DHA2 family multidrug resistance protein
MPLHKLLRRALDTQLPSAVRAIMTPAMAWISWQWRCVCSTNRSPGGAIGIAVASQLVVERQKLHAMRIGEAVTPYADAFRQRAVELVRMFSGGHVPSAAALPHGLPGGAHEAALAWIRQHVMRDALFMACSDTFLLAGIAMLACAAGGLLLKPPKAIRG